MTQPGSDERIVLSPEQFEIATRSENQASYLTLDQLARIPKDTCAEKSKAQAGDISGTAFEQVLADVTGGVWIPKRDAADLVLNGIGYSVKTQAPKEAACRSKWTDWLQHDLMIKMHHVTPADNFPTGQNVLNCSAVVLGRRICDAYNQKLIDYGVERLAVVVRLVEQDEQRHRYLLWFRDLEPLVASDYKWISNSRTAVQHSIKAVAKVGDGKSELFWDLGSGNLHMRQQIPIDADTWTVPFSDVKSREEATRRLLAT